MAQCPTCGKALATKRGMRQHHTKVHGNPLPNRECNNCQREFYDPKARRSYCDDCNPNAVEENGNWRGGQTSTECRICGDEFEYYPSNKEGIYCGECVEDAEEFLGIHYADVHGIEPESSSCEYCGETFDILPCYVRRGGGRFCSHDCLCSWMSDRWGDGEAVYRGKWLSVRRSVLRRDQYRCQYCGATSAELGMEPDVHHIEPVRNFDDPEDAHFPANLISLCKTCHSLAEWGSIPTPDPEP